MKETLRGLDTVRVNKTALIRKLRENRDQHRGQFEKGLELYRKAVVRELEEQLERARRNETVVRFSALTQPEDHTADYDHAIELLDMSLDDEVELTAEEFARYVRDDWGWKRQFADALRTTRTYLEDGGTRRP